MQGNVLWKIPGGGETTAEGNNEKWRCSGKNEKEGKRRKLHYERRRGIMSRNYIFWVINSKENAQQNFEPQYKYPIAIHISLLTTNLTRVCPSTLRTLCRWCPWTWGIVDPCPIQQNQRQPVLRWGTKHKCGAVLLFTEYRFWPRGMKSLIQNDCSALHLRWLFLIGENKPI